MENDYVGKDEKGRVIFEKLCTQQKWCKHIKNSTDKYAVWDNAYLSGNTQMIGEIKFRNYDSEAFDSWFLEVDKYNSLNQLKNSINSETKITYINHFKDDQTIIWNLTNLDIKDYKITKLWLQKNDFDTTLVEKEVIYLHHNLAIFKTATIDSILVPLTDEQIEQKDNEQDATDDFLTSIF